MDAENFVVNDGCEGQVVKDLCAVAPHVDGAVLAKTFIVETVHLSDLSRLVIASDESDTFRVAHLKSQEEEECLDGVVATIHEVAHEEIVGVGALAAHLEQLHQVIELTMDVTANLQPKPNQVLKQRMGKSQTKRSAKKDVRFRLRLILI